MSFKKPSLNSIFGSNQSSSSCSSSPSSSCGDSGCGSSPAEDMGHKEMNRRQALGAMAGAA
ncbi:MAG: hypothetical protein GY915_09280, partial [bacterium]|nr:hypothetical protein [bacterium]